jgi:hypothetical protein
MATAYFVFVLVPIIFSNVVFGAPQKERHYEYIQRTLERLSAEGKFPIVVDPPHLWQLGISARTAPPNPDDYFRPKLIIWDPLTQRTINEGQLKCPRIECVSSSMNLLRPVRWKNGANSGNVPRTLFDCNKGSTFLVSRVYRCPRNHEILAHDENILKLFPQRDRLPFILSHIGGLTRELYDYIISHSSCGFKISQIEHILKQQKLEDFEIRRQMFEEDKGRFKDSNSKFDTFESEMPDELKSPSNDFISLCIIHDYLAKESLYRQCMAQTTCTWFSCDHTFKIASNVGVLRKSDKKWEKQYDSVFFVLNEDGVVLTWQLTKGTAFSQVNSLFHTLYQRFCAQGKTVNMCVIDNCCSWRKKLQTVFGSQLTVLLDLFHAVQRIVKCISKKHPFA